MTKSKLIITFKKISLAKSKSDNLKLKFEEIKILSNLIS